MSENKGQELYKKGPRQVSDFIGREFLYDFLTDRLDPQRASAVKERLKHSREAQAQLRAIESAIEYSTRLSDTKVSEPILEKIQQGSGALSTIKKHSNFEDWPLAMKWAAEGTIVSIMVLVLVVVVPWKRLFINHWITNETQVTLTELEKQPKASIEKLKELETFERPEFEDDELKSKASEEIAMNKSTAKSSPEKAASAQPNKTAEPTPPIAENNKKPTEGFLYRGEISVTNLEAVGPKIKDQIISLGGRKAGEVELGWQKTPQVAYFHFTIPEAKYNDLLTFLSTYGQAKLNKEKHPRVMPDGIVRLIINVNEANR